MYKYRIFRQVASTVAGICGTTRSKRRLNRDKVRYNGLIATVGQTKLPRKKYETKIPVAFCFDARGCKMAVAFALYPVTMRQIIDIADTGNIMPPKTTWFEPKLRSGLVIHKLS